MEKKEFRKVTKKGHAINIVCGIGALTCGFLIGLVTSNPAIGLGVAVIVYAACKLAECLGSPDYGE